jgi:hypothetical protein
MSSDLAYAERALLQAHDIYSAHDTTRYHAAQTALPLATLALARHDFNAALKHTETALPAAQASGNALLLASLMLTKAEALTALGRASDARSVRLDSLGWARYGFGSDQQVRTRANEIAALVHR